MRGKNRGAPVDGGYAYFIERLDPRQTVTIRFDWFDPNRTSSSLRRPALGASYIFLLDVHTRLMVAYEHPMLQRNDPSDDLVTVRLQYRFSSGKL